ncbi:MAG: proline--tRNA ligase [Hyphomicrobium sp.]
MSKRALAVSREQSFPEWYQTVVRDGDMAETSPVRGCMIIKPWGWGVWERIQAELDGRIKETGHENCYFPLFIPMSFIAKEAEHVEGFAKEMAVVTHHRLKNEGGKLVLDPDAVLDEPLIVRPTSETIIGDAFQRWVKSYRDLPLLINQWANVVRWEMRTRLFLRTAEFLWQEGHTAHADRDDAMDETMRMLEVYRSFAEEELAMPVIAGEKPANERFPGADNTFSIEAMMQDGKALQAGTSHYLGTHFARAQNIQFQSAEGKLEHCHTTSWGVSTRLIGGVIMSHGDDDGLRLPPRIAPRQIVIVPMLRDKPEDAALLESCGALEKALKSQGIRVLVDTKPVKSAEKRWGWVRRGAPVIIELGGRDISSGNVTFMRRDKLRDGDKIVSHTRSRDAFVAEAPALLAGIQAALHAEAKARLDGNIVTSLKTFDELSAYFGVTEAEDESGPFRGWAQVAWSRPEGAKLDAIGERLKALKLTIRNAPLAQEPVRGKCVFTGEPAKENVLIARAY